MEWSVVGVEGIWSLGSVGGDVGEAFDDSVFSRVRVDQGEGRGVGGLFRSQVEIIRGTAEDTIGKTTTNYKGYKKNVRLVVSS